MSRWTHVICEEDWWQANPNREPVRVVRPPGEPLEPLPCCFCARVTTSSIYVRADPKDLECKGEGAAHRPDD